MTVGFSSKPFEVVRAHYVARDPDKGIDEVTPVVERAMAVYEGGVELPITATFVPVDELADILAVLGDEPRVRTQDVLYRLQDRNAVHYGAWTFGDLKSALEPYGAAPYKSNGIQVVARDRVQDAVLERLAEDEVDFDDE